MKQHVGEFLSRLIHPIFSSAPSGRQTGEIWFDSSLNKFMAQDVSAAGDIVTRDANSNIFGNNFLADYATTATAAGTTTLTVSSKFQQFFTGTTTQTVVLPVVTTLGLGHTFFIANNSTGVITINSSGGNLVTTLSAGQFGEVTCILLTGTTASSWRTFKSATGVNTGNETSDTIRAIIQSNAELIPIDGYETNYQFLTMMNSNTNSRRLSWGNLKAALKTYFDALTTTLTNKSISLGSNTITGTLAQFNTACTDADFATTTRAKTAGEAITVSTVPMAVSMDTTGNIIASNTTAYNRSNFFGFITASVANAGSAGVIASNGMVVGGFSGLTVGASYYLSATSGLISTSVGALYTRVGYAISATEIIIDKEIEVARVTGVQSGYPSTLYTSAYSPTHDWMAMVLSTSGNGASDNISIQVNSVDIYTAPLASAGAQSVYGPKIYGRVGASVRARQYATANYGATLTAIICKMFS